MAYNGNSALKIISFILVFALTGCGGGGGDETNSNMPGQKYTPGQDGNYYLAGYLEVCGNSQCNVSTPAAGVDVQFDSHISERLTVTDANGYFEIAYPTSAYAQLPAIVCLTYGNALSFTRINGVYTDLVPSSFCFNKSSLQQGFFDRRMNGSGELPKTVGTRMGIAAATENDVVLERYLSGFRSTIIHLGDASFQGSANSELQAGTQGASATFIPKNLAGGIRIPAEAKQLCVEFLARGVQTSSGNADVVSFSGIESWARTSRITLSDSPQDGSFGIQFHCVDLIQERPSNARISQLSITINTGSRQGTTDLDDFEFMVPVARFR